MKHSPILVIDDEESMTAMVAGYLDAKGYPVTVANDEIGRASCRERV